MNKIQEAADDPTFRTLGISPPSRPNAKRAPFAIAIFVPVLAVAEAYCDTEWKAIILLGAMLGPRVVMEKTGGAQCLGLRSSKLSVSIPAPAP
ncbi:MAG: hypothetical protein H0X73_03155 [Chthoniobacterales bacterium]|nr:hypothetical protein [Chthoniobacterales bacterium]